MRFSRVVFLVAGVWGFLCLTPMYFLQGQIAGASGPITHPEMFYGFVGVALAWQPAFLVMSRDPLRYRPLMPVAVLEKAAFGMPVLWLYAGGKVSAAVLVFGCIDLLLGALFAAAFLCVRREARA